MVWVNSGNLRFWSMPCCLDLMGLRSRQMQKRRDKWEDRVEGMEEAERSYSEKKNLKRY